jgi:RimJ/RimL family protein N-acetyltransferase
MIETERTLLREFRSSDFADVHAYTSDPVVQRYWPGHAYTAVETREFLANCAEDRRRLPRIHYRFAIVLRENSRVIGGTAIENIVHAQREATLGYTLHRDFWSRGLMTEVVERLLGFAFIDLRLHRLIALCHTDNGASERVLLRCGFLREGTLREHQRLGDHWQSSHLYALLDHEFAAKARQRT